MNDDELLARLDDPLVWAEPGSGLEERVVAAVAAESVQVRSRRWWPVAAVAAVAAVLLGVGVAVPQLVHRADVVYLVALDAGPLQPGASGTAELTKTPSGWEIHVQAQGLPRRQDGRYYEAWLKNASGRVVSVGTFNDGRDVTLWSGVSPKDFRTLTVTQEVADGVAASSRRVVLIGHAVEQ